MAELFSQPVNRILPHIFEKDAVCVPPSTPLENACHFLFATKHYQDGVVVAEDDSPIGRIGGGHILWQVRENIKNLKKKASQRNHGEITYPVFRGQRFA